MPKYDPLTHHLRNSGRPYVPMSFEDIEQVIGAELPPRASKQRAWWSNNPTNNVMTMAWLAAGYESVTVDMTNRKLVFRRLAPDDPPQGPTAHQTGSFARVFGALKGTVTTAPGLDLTEPISENWNAAR